MNNLKCLKCANNFDKNQRIPRVLPHCGHTVCSFCIQFELNTFQKFVCPKDKTSYSDFKNTKNFPINEAILEFLQDP